MHFFLTTLNLTSYFMRSNKWYLRTIRIQGLLLVLMHESMATSYANVTFKIGWWTNSSVFTVSLNLPKIYGLLWKGNTNPSM
ncbi:hypothetical protein YC2023_115274 [Brassica napus]